MSKNFINILCIQIESRAGDKLSNFKKIRQLLTPFQTESIDLIVLPEYFAVGMDNHLFPKLAEPLKGETGNFLAQLASDFSSNLVGGTFIESFGQQLYNTCCVFNRLGQNIAQYRKIHLYNFLGGTEGRYLTPGNRLVTVDLDFGTIGLAICFDLMFPLHFHRLATMKSDLMVIPSAWVVPNGPVENLKNDCEMFQNLVRVRAYETVAAQIVATQIGNIGKLQAIGYSQVVDCQGKILANAENQEKIIIATLDLRKNSLAKRRLPLASLST